MRYPRQCASLVGLQVPLLAHVNPQATVIAFLGDDAKGAASEWASADKGRQVLALTSHCLGLSSQLQATAKSLEATMRTDCDQAKVELQEAKDAVPVEEARVFAELRRTADAA